MLARCQVKSSQVILVYLDTDHDSELLRLCASVRRIAPRIDATGHEAAFPLLFGSLMETSVGPHQSNYFARNRGERRAFLTSGGRLCLRPGPEARWSTAVLMASTFAASVAIREDMSCRHTSSSVEGSTCRKTGTGQGWGSGG